MEITLDPLYTAAGVGLSVVADRAYASLNLPNNQIAGIPFEHTHVGLAAYVLALKTKEKKRLKYRGTFVGFGTGLIIEDAVPGPQPGNWFGLLPEPSQPYAPTFVMGLYAIEFGALVALAARNH